MLITGDPITGRRAYEVGLVGHVVPDGTALAKARDIADRIARNGPLAVRNIKASVLAADALPRPTPTPARWSWAWRSWPRRTPARGRGPSWRSANRTTPAPDPAQRARRAWVMGGDSPPGAARP